MATSLFVRYVPAVSLLACPFCREMFEAHEETHCPHCGLALRRFEDLPPSADAMAEEAPPAPEVETLPWTFWKRGRGALLAIGAAGLGLFFLPWIRESFPDTFTFTGFLLASKTKNLFWVWSTAVAWFVLLPLVFTRRSILALRGARVAAAFLSAMPGLTVANVWLHPPGGMRVSAAMVLQVHFSYGWAFWGTMILSVIGVAVSLMLGGPLEQRPRREPTPSGRMLH